MFRIGDRSSGTSKQSDTLVVHIACQPRCFVRELASILPLSIHSNVCLMVRAHAPGGSGFGTLLSTATKELSSSPELEYLAGLGIRSSVF